MTPAMREQLADLAAALHGWREAKPNSAAERRAGRLLAYRASEVLAASRPPTNCAACNSTLREIARLGDLLTAHEQLPGHRLPAEGH